MKTKRGFFVWLLSSFVTIALSAQNVAKYEIKSAIIQKEVVMMGQKINATWYIDGFGQKESAEMSMMDKHIRILTEGKSIITIDLDQNVGNRMEFATHSRS
jgi:hypothetical protein